MKRLSDVTRKDQRIFGMVLGSFFTIVWILKVWIRGVPFAECFSMYPVVSTLGGIGVLLFLLGMLAPSTLRYPYVPFFYFGRTVAQLNTALLLLLSYALLVFPIGIVMRILNKDPMRRKWNSDAATYWVPREKEKQKSLISERQF